MLDLSLDYDRGRTFDCENCDVGTQKLRNCANRFKPKKIPLNDEVYEQCPRSLTFNKHSYDYLVTLYFNCRRDNTWPHGKSMIGETAFTKHLFDFCDEVTNKYRAKKDAEMKRKMEAQTKGIKSNGR